jgi:hypothetical protein
MNNSSPFSKVIKEVELVINHWVPKLMSLPTAIIADNRNTQDRSIKQLVGHLIDSASNNHQRIVRLQYKRNLDFPDYRQDNDTWITLQDYQNESWENMVNLWKYYNLHITHIISRIDEECFDHTWTNFEGKVVSLEELVNYYLVHLNLHIKEIEELIG